MCFYDSKNLRWSDQFKGWVGISVGKIIFTGVSKNSIEEILPDTGDNVKVWVL